MKKRRACLMRILLAGLLLIGCFAMTAFGQNEKKSLSKFEKDFQKEPFEMSQRTDLFSASGNVLSDQARKRRKTDFISKSGSILSDRKEENQGTEASEGMSNFLGKTILISAGDHTYLYTYEKLGAEPVPWDLSDPLLGEDETGNAAWNLNRKKLAAAFTVDQKKATAAFQKICDDLSEAPENGTVRMIGNYPVVEGGKDGVSYSWEAAYDRFREIVSSDRADSGVTYRLELTQTVISAEVTADTVTFSSSPIGEYITYGLGTENRETNIRLSAEGLNGTLVMPGEQISALTLYGPVTEECGYKEAPVYNSGKQLYGIGGGICQTTTTLYNACLRAELNILLRRQHSMLVSYVPPSMDAMVDYATGSDFIAENNTGYPLYLEASTGVDSDGDSYVQVRIWGRETRPENRTVEFSSEVLAFYFPEPLYEENSIDDTICTYGLVSLEEKFSILTEAHPFVQSRAWKTVSVNGEVVSCEMLPGGYGSCDQYRAMAGSLRHASDCRVDYWLVDDPDTYLGQRVHYQITFLNGSPWNEEDPLGDYQEKW